MQKIGAYERVAHIAQTNTGVVHAARRSDLPRDPLIALKVIKSKLVTNRYREALAVEAPPACAFDHPNAVRFTELTPYDEHVLHVMELVRGRTLQQVLERTKLLGRTLPPALLVRVFLEIARAFGDGHNLAHGEFSAESVFIEWDGSVKVLGLGIGRARLLFPPSRSRLCSRAPELFERKAFDTAIDVYGLGVTIYDSIVGGSVFARETPADTIRAILDNRFDPLWSLFPELGEVGTIVDCMMSRAPEVRPNMYEVVATLAAGSEDEFSHVLAEEMSALFALELERDIEPVTLVDEVPLSRLSGVRTDTEEGTTPFDRSWERASTPSEIDSIVDAIMHAPKITPVPAVAESSPAPDPGDNGRMLSSVVRPVLEGDGLSPGHNGRMLNMRPWHVVRPVPDGDGLSPGEIIAERYRVVGKIGIGGMAIVYEVEHTLLAKRLALKLLRPELSNLPFVAQRFQREARLASSLDDRHIVRVIDFGRAESGSLFLVMELIDGVPLSQLISKDALLPIPTTLSILRGILLGLAHAHARGVIHRDLKPDNVMVNEQQTTIAVKLLDFGIAKPAQPPSPSSPAAASVLTQAGMVFGSPRYMSPEQAAGEDVDAQTDLYAAGVVLYELLSGRRPFDGTDSRAILRAVLREPPPPLDLSQVPTVTACALQGVVLRALEKSRDARYSSAQEFHEALYDIVSANPALASPRALI